LAKKGSPQAYKYAHCTWEKRKVGTTTYTNLTWENNFAARLGGAVGIGAAASRKAVWWDLRLASLLTHLFLTLPFAAMQRVALV